MIRAILRDSAIAAAKAAGHATVEPRHVLYAAARHFRSRPEIGSLFDVARKALEPRGEVIDAPGISPEAESLLASWSSESEIVDSVLVFLRTGAEPSAEEPTPAAEEQAALPQVRVEEAASGEPIAAESTSAVLAELDALIGLTSVKRRVREITAVVQANQERIRAGMPAVSPGLHLVFTGPPGTGKTTVARLVARLYAAAGALPGANFTEVGRADLVAGYVGQTAIKTADVIRRTRPGVLFIDEAYYLTPSHGSDFGAEAIATLVKAMEDHRDELAVIAAGYGEQMAEFVGSNPGLRSRFRTYIDFPDYSPDDLMQIFEGFAENAVVNLEDGVREAAGRIFTRAALSPGFGNARFARSLFEQAYARMAARAVADGTMALDEITALSAADLEWQEGALEKGGRRIGFTRQEEVDGA